MLCFDGQNRRVMRSDFQNKIHAQGLGYDNTRERDKENTQYNRDITNPEVPGITKDILQPGECYLQ